MNKILIVFLLILAIICAVPAIMAEESCVFRTSNTPVFSRGLGVSTIAVYVIVDNARHNGLYLTSAPPDGSLAAHMGLRKGNIVLKLDGYAMSSTQIADNWLSRRTPKPLSFTYAVVESGKAKVYSNQMIIPGSQPVGQTMQTGNSTAAVISNQYSIDELESYDFSLINQARRNEGVRTLVQDSALSRLARSYAEYMTQHPEKYVYLQGSPHMDLEGRSPMARARDAGITREVHENLNMQSRGSVDDRALILRMHQRMMAEPPVGHNHRTIMLDANAQAVGIGIARKGTLIYMAEEFGH